MKKTVSKDRSKKYVVLFFAAACLCFLIVAAVLYFASGEKEGAYFYENDGEGEPVAITPAGRGGISQDQIITIQWDRHLGDDLTDAVVLHPSARGKWSVAGNKLIFTPQKLAPGTYYTVSIPKGTVLNDDGDTLQETVFFAFETEDTSLRFPRSEGFSLNERGYRFTTTDDVALPVAYVGEDDAVFHAEVLKAQNTAAFSDAFAKLYAYPAWAKLSIRDFRASEKNFHLIFEGDLSLSEKGLLDLGTLPQGQYLVKISHGNEEVQRAVTVSDIDAFALCDRGSIVFWSHVDAVANSNGEVTVAGRTCALDKQGVATLAFDPDPYTVAQDPGRLAYTVSDGKDEEIAMFLCGDDVAAADRGDIYLNLPTATVGDDITVSGRLLTRYGSAIDDSADLELRSEIGVIDSVKVTTENGVFATVWEDIALPDGDYRFVLRYHGVDVAAADLRVERPTARPYLTVATPTGAEEDDMTEAGDVDPGAFIYLKDAGGRPVGGGSISLNGGEAVAVDGEGKIPVTAVGAVPAGITTAKRTYTAKTPYGDVEPIVIKDDVAEAAQVESTTATEEVVVNEENILAVTSDRNGLTVADKGERPALILSYENGVYTTVASARSPQIDVTDAITVDGGDAIRCRASTDVDCDVLRVFLVKGGVAAGLVAADVRWEQLNDVYDGTVVATKTVFNNRRIDASFSTLGLSGDYYLRIAAANGDKVSVRYLPVTVTGPSLHCEDVLMAEAGKAATISFAIEGATDRRYTVTLGDDVSEGRGSGVVTVELPAKEVGVYEGKVTLYGDGGIAAEKQFYLDVYVNTPFLRRVADTGEGEPFCYVRTEAKDAMKTLLDISLLPGDQILQRMGRILCRESFGERWDDGAFYAAADLSAYQKSDGGFPRFKGGESDLLLTVFVAENDNYICDRSALLAYLKARLATATDAQTAAMACWGLSCFNINCDAALDQLLHGDDKSAYTTICLAEAYFAAGDKATALSLYEDACDDIVGDGAVLREGEINDDYTVNCLCFLEDLALKLHREVDPDILAALYRTDIKVQTARYLLTSVLTRLYDGDVFADTAGKGISPLYIGADNVHIADLSLERTDGDGDIHVGDVVTAALQWEGSDNSIYLISAADTAAAAVVADSSFARRGGRYERITADATATVAFRALSAGDAVIPDIYVYDLTRGEIVGFAKNGGWKVMP